MHIFYSVQSGVFAKGFDVSSTTSEIQQEQDFVNIAVRSVSTI